MSNRKVLGLVLVIAGIFFLFALSSCGASRKMGCPMSFGRTHVPARY